MRFWTAARVKESRCVFLSLSPSLSLLLSLSFSLSLLLLLSLCVFVCIWWGEMPISQFFILTPRGDTIVAKDYRGDVVRGRSARERERESVCVCGVCGCVID